MDSTGDLFKPLNICFKIFKILGLWQDGSQSWSYFIYGYLVHFVMIYVQMCFQVNYLFNASDIADFIDTIGMFTAFVGTTFKYSLWLYNIKDIIKLVEMLKEDLRFSSDVRFGERKHIVRQSTIVLRVYLIFWGSAIMSCTASIFPPIFSHKKPYNVLFPFETDYAENAIGFWFSSYYSIFDMYIVVSERWQCN